MNDYREGERCYSHPKEAVIGVCALCLNERLLILAEKQGQPRRHKRNCSSNSSSSNRHGSISLHKVFALGSLLSRLDVRHHKTTDFYDSSASTSREESFISINFENNGTASWEKCTVPKVSLDHCDMASWGNGKGKKEPGGLKSVMEHTKQHPSSLRWRKRIGHLFQLARWKRSTSKASVCHVAGSKLDGVKVRHGWIRNLTKRRTKE